MFVTTWAGSRRDPLHDCRGTADGARPDARMTSYHAFRLVRFDESDIVFDPPPQRGRARPTTRDVICGAGGEGPWFVPTSRRKPPSTPCADPRGASPSTGSRSRRTPSRSARRSATPRAVRRLQLRRGPRRRMLLRLGADATAGAVWRGSAGSADAPPSPGTRRATPGSPAAIDRRRPPASWPSPGGRGGACTRLRPAPSDADYAPALADRRCEACGGLRGRGPRRGRRRGRGRQAPHGARDPRLKTYRSPCG